MSNSTLTNPVTQEEVLSGVAESIQAADQQVLNKTPDELAEQKIDEQLASDQDYGAAAGALFALYGTRLYAAIDALKTNQLKRILKTLCVYPLEDQFINTKNPLEKQAYLLANKMIESKFLITLDTVAKEEQRRKALTEEQKAKTSEVIAQAKEFMEDNKELMQDLAKQEELEINKTKMD